MVREIKEIMGLDEIAKRGEDQERFLYKVVFTKRKEKSEVVYMRERGGGEEVMGKEWWIEEKKEEVETEQILEGKTFVVTGSLNHFDNRKQLKEEIEQMGGKVTGSVSKKTDYLINNDKMSQSSKNKKAMELEIPILSEEDFLELIGR